MLPKVPEFRNPTLLPYINSFQLIVLILSISVYDSPELFYFNVNVKILKITTFYLETIWKSQ